MQQAIVKTKPKTSELIFKVLEGLEYSVDHKRARIAVEAILHCMAERLTIDQGIEVISNLPVHLKEIFSQGWKPFNEISPEKDFFEAVKFRLAGYFKGYTDTDFFHLVRKIIEVFERSIHPDKLQKIRGHYASDLKQILNN